MTGALETIGGGGGGAKQVSRFVDELDLSLMSTRSARVSAECPAVTCRVRARQWHELSLIHI